MDDSYLTMSNSMQDNHIVKPSSKSSDGLCSYHNSGPCHAIILAGGSGTRLWPLSRALYPKQLLTLHDDYSLLQETLRRVLTCFAPEHIHVVTNQEHFFLVREQCLSLDTRLTDCVIAEPCGRGTLPAVLLGLDAACTLSKLMQLEVASPERLSSDAMPLTLPNIAVFPSDHMIQQTDRWRDSVKHGLYLASQGHFVTFGIPPSYPETGYGYILRGEGISRENAHMQDGDIHFMGADSSGIDSMGIRSNGTLSYLGALASKRPTYKVENFVEKPDKATANAYLRDGRYLWNSGMFVLNSEKLLSTVQAQQKSLWAWWQERHTSPLSTRYATLPSISMDHGIMEEASKTSQVAVIEVNFSWDDLGSFEALHRFEDKDQHGCVLQGDTMALDCQDSMLLSHGGKLVGIGLNNMIAIQTRDATLVCPRHKTQMVKDVVAQLKAEESPLIKMHVTVYRPWGSYTVLEEQAMFKIKRITVKAGARLSLQLHHHRSEHWVVVKGTALAEINGEEILCTENQWAVIPCGARHRLSNPGKISLELIEIQRGSYLEEDDIIRLDDVYGRSNKA